MQNETFFAPPLNAALRRRAFLCYRQYAGSFLLALILSFSLSDLLPTLLPPLREGVLSVVWQWLLYPISTLGFYRMALKALDQQPPKAADFFFFCRSAGRYLLAFFTGVAADSILIFSAIAPLFSLYWLQLDSFPEAVWPLLLILLFLLLLLFFFSVRLALLPYLLAVGRVKNPFQGISFAWKKTKGHFFSILWFQISLIVPPLLLAALATALVTFFAGQSVSSILNSLWGALLNPYFILTETQFFACFFTPVPADSANEPDEPQPLL